MATVIADTSTLQYLFQIGCLEILPELFGTVLVPHAVRDELLVGISLGVKMPNPADYTWMSLRPTSRSPVLESFELGLGEHAALALALSSEDGLVILDDAAARAAASSLGIATTGTLGVLLLAKQRKLINAIAQPLADLEARGFRMTGALRLHVLRLADEE